MVKELEFLNALKKRVGLGELGGPSDGKNGTGDRRKRSKSKTPKPPIQPGPGSGML